MKKIINGKVYDTNTATKLGEYSRLYPGDFDYICEELYQKRTGEFFLYGEGGARSKYSKQTGNNTWSGSSKIIPLTFDSAREWTEEHLDADTYEAIFGEVSEDGSKKQMCISITQSASEKLRKESQKRECSISELVEKLVLDL